MNLQNIYDVLHKRYMQVKVCHDLKARELYLLRGGEEGEDSIWFQKGTIEIKIMKKELSVLRDVKEMIQEEINHQNGVKNTWI